MNRQTTVLGGGLVGGFIARQLALDPRYSVQLCDISSEALEQNRLSAELAGSSLQTARADLSDSAALKALIADSDLVIGEDDDLLASGLIDSLGAMALIHFIERDLGIDVPAEDVTIEHFASLRAIDAYLGRRGV